MPVLGVLRRWLNYCAQVPQHVRDQIKALHLLGYRGDSEGNGQQNGSSNGSHKPQLLGAPAGAA